MMLPLQIAFRFLKSSLGQTISIVLGISVGVSVQVFIGSLIGGLQDSLVQTTIGNSSQITITASGPDAELALRVAKGIWVGIQPRYQGIPRPNPASAKQPETLEVRSRPAQANARRGRTSHRTGY